MKSSCEYSHIKGSMWSRAAVLQRRSGPDGFLSVRQTCSPPLCFVLLCYMIYCSSLWTDLFSTSLSICFVPWFYSLIETMEVTCKKRRCAGCILTTCVCVCARTLARIHQDVHLCLLSQRQQVETRCCQGENKECRTVLVFFFNRVGGYSACLQQIVEQKAG